MRTLLVAIISWSLLTTVSAADAPDSYWTDYHKGMKEPVLPPVKFADGDFQFRWMRLSIAGEPLSIRVWQHHGHAFVRSVRLEYKLDFSLGQITRDQTIPLSEKQLARLRSSFAGPKFWRPFNPTEKAFENDFLDGAHWLFELSDSSGYRFISMFSPPLFLRDANPPKIPKGMRSWRPYVRMATALLRTTNIFPGEREAWY